MQMRDHQYGVPIVDVKFHRESKRVISSCRFVREFYLLIFVVKLPKFGVVVMRKINRLMVYLLEPCLLVLSLILTLLTWQYNKILVKHFLCISYE